MNRLHEPSRPPSHIRPMPHRPTLLRTSTTASRWASLALPVLCLALSVGCSRAFYRRQADADAYALVRQKANQPHWALDNYTIAVDPRSRMYDPFCLDAPPMPPDDPTSHEFMHCVDNKRGYPGWHDDGDAAFVENPAWKAYLHIDQNGILRLSADDAVRMALLHSRQYQQEMEDLYLSALDVSFERFRFDSQFFGGYSVFYTADGYRRPGGFNNSRSELNASLFSNGPRPLAVQKAFTSGATLVAGVANSMIWQFSGPDDHTATTIVDFTLIQPLLRNAGRDRVMERLTRSERILLANVRAMQQYRGGFYVNIMTGRDPGQGPQRQGGVFGAGLEGFSGVGGGGFGRVQTAATGQTGQGGGGQGAGAGAVGGYFGLLQAAQTIRNQEDNIERLRNNLFRLQQVLEELRNRSGEPDLVANILRQDLQVAQARQALVNSESRLINSRNDYQSLLDNFKLTLGLPPEVCLDVQDNLLDPFQLIDRRTSDEFNGLDDMIATIGEVRLRISQQIRTQQQVDPLNPAISRVIRVLPWYDELPADLAALKERLLPLQDVRQRLLEEHVPLTRQAISQFANVIDRRRQQIIQLRKAIEESGQEACALLPLANFNRDLLNADRLDESLRDLERKLDALERKFEVGYAESLTRRNRRIDEILARGESLPPEQLFEQIYDGVLYPRQTVGAEGQQAVDIITELPADMLALQLLQARARTEAVELPSVELPYQQAIEVARRNRRDWMNARSSLVDSWRLIRFNADQLQSTLNIVFSGDISNTGDNPIRLRDTTGRLRAGVQFDAPLTRLSERNTYRQSLIEYQQARRNYYAFEDGISRVLRSDLRTILTNQINFELQRLAMLEAARQVDRNEDIRVDQELSNQASGATAARDAVSALSDLLDAQNNFMSIYTNYEALRRALDFDLGTIQLTGEGLWVDPEKIGKDYGQTDPWEWEDCENNLLLPGDEYDPSEEELPPPNPRNVEATALYLSGLQLGGSGQTRPTGSASASASASDSD